VGNTKDTFYLAIGETFKIKLEGFGNIVLIDLFPELIDRKIVATVLALVTLSIFDHTAFYDSI
jgi:hypothetical protein